MVACSEYTQYGNLPILGGVRSPVNHLLTLLVNSYTDFIEINFKLQDKAD